MLEKILASVIVRVLTQLGKDLYAWVSDMIRKAKRAAGQKKTIDKLNKDDAKPVRDDETRKDEEDYLNS
jgi:hypothetical protein